MRFRFLDNLMIVAFLLYGSLTAENQRLNVLFIVIDDLRTALGCYGDPLARSPNIDGLANEGIRFDRAYCQQAVCNPSRASFMTGLRPDTLGIWDNRVHFREDHPDILTLPQYLKQNGYHAHGIGKIFHDPDWAQDPFSWSEPARQVPTTAEGKYALRENMIPLQHHGPAFERSENQVTPYIDTRVRNDAVEFLRREHDRPFFLAVGFRRPHLPFSAPAEFWNMHDRKNFYPVPHAEQTIGTAPWALPEFQEHRGYSNIPEGDQLSLELVAELRHGYYAAISFVDSLVGDLLRTLQEEGLRENTLIVLLTDHGYHIGERGHWCKTTNFELDARVPLIIDVPGIKGGENRDQLVELVDLYPTIVDLCGMRIPDTLDGISIVPVLQDPRAKHKDFALTQFPRPWNPRGNPEIDVMGYSLRTRDHRYIEWIKPDSHEIRFTELYSYSDDLWEERNLAGKSQLRGVKDKFHKKLHKLIGKDSD